MIAPLPAPLAALGLLVAVLAQSAAVVQVFRGLTAGAPTVEPWMPLLFHVAGTLLAMEGLYRALPEEAQQPPARIRTYIALSTFFVPVFGAIGVATSVVMPLRWPAFRAGRDPIRTTEPPKLPVRPGVAVRRYGEGSLYGKLRHSPDAGVRLKAVMAIRDMVGRDAVPLLRLALHDSSDEVRLLAYAILDGRERGIYRRIKELRIDLAVADDEDKPGARIQLAEQYWELVYQGLVEGELLVYVLGQALTHLEEALEADPASASLRLLMGRIQLAQRDYDGSEASFQAARELGLPPRVVDVYLAELAFARRRFGEVRRYIKALEEPARSRPIVRQLAEYWQ